MVKTNLLNLEDELDKQFPKGDKSRGKALVLYAVAQIKIQDTKKELIDRVEKIIDEWWEKRTSESDKGVTFQELKEQIEDLKDKNNGKSYLC